MDLVEARRNHGPSLRIHGQRERLHAGSRVQLHLEVCGLHVLLVLVVVHRVGAGCCRDDGLVHDRAALLQHRALHGLLGLGQVRQGGRERIPQRLLFELGLLRLQQPDRRCQRLLRGPCLPLNLRLLGLQPPDLRCQRLRGLGLRWHVFRCSTCFLRGCSGGSLRRSILWRPGRWFCGILHELLRRQRSHIRRRRLCRHLRGLRKHLCSVLRELLHLVDGASAGVLWFSHGFLSNRLCRLRRCHHVFLSRRLNTYRSSIR
mmetsp:Transcript_79685/g.215797  ORF Transcript_79685/g.215797 Transcript_79685/m.215797 type:complete len:260 (-) Transcript_79685:29-808(-)